jgi:hypothetical protein
MLEKIEVELAAALRPAEKSRLRRRAELIWWLLTPDVTDAAQRG